MIQEITIAGKKYSREMPDKPDFYQFYNALTGIQFEEIRGTNLGVFIGTRKGYTEMQLISVALEQAGFDDIMEDIMEDWREISGATWVAR